GKESNDDSDDGSDKDSEETVKSGAGKMVMTTMIKMTMTMIKRKRLLRMIKSSKRRSVEDTHVILTPVNPDDPQESSYMSSFISSMLNPLSDEGVESIFTTTSSQIVSLV
nr:hypothetical protein [Tanacetum cinerariifolium]